MMPPGISTSTICGSDPLFCSTTMNSVRVQISPFFQWLSVRTQRIRPTALAWEAKSSNFSLANVVALAMSAMIAMLKSASPIKNNIHKNRIRRHRDISLHLQHAACGRLVQICVLNEESSSARLGAGLHLQGQMRSEEHTSELQSHSFISYAVFCLK